MAQPWRGNVRELEHVLLNVWVMSDAEELDCADFDFVLGQRTSPSQQPPARRATESVDSESQVVRSRARTASQDERSRILQALDDCGQNRVKAAQQLGIPRRTFYRRLRDYGIG
ncbi:MAG: helix-turn-helix domain-containing protein [Polyangiaceae bacterium]